MLFTVLWSSWIATVPEKLLLEQIDKTTRSIKLAGVMIEIRVKETGVGVGPVKDTGRTAVTIEFPTQTDTTIGDGDKVLVPIRVRSIFMDKRSNKQSTWPPLMLLMRTQLHAPWDLEALIAPRYRLSDM